MKGWVGLVGCPVADSLPTLVVTHQLQVERRTGKVCQSETNILPLCYVTNRSQPWAVLKRPNLLRWYLRCGLSFFQRIYVIRWGHVPPVGRGNIEGIVRPIVKYCECYSLRCSIDVACHCQYCCSLLSVDEEVFCYCSCCKMCRLWHMHLALTGAIHWLWQHGVGDHRPYSANRTVVHSQTAPGTPLSTCLSTFISWWHLDYRS